MLLEREPCAQAEELLALVARHGNATLAAAKSACNLGCARGCGVAGELALTGQLERSDPDLGGVLGRQGCDRGDARSCFIEGAYLEGRTQGDPTAVQAYEKACSLHEKIACATLLRLRNEGTRVVQPIAAPTCPRDRIGMWVHVRHIGPDAFEELVLGIDELPDHSVSATLARRDWFNTPFPLHATRGTFTSETSTKRTMKGELREGELYLAGTPVEVSGPMSKPAGRDAKDELRARFESPNELRADDLPSTGASVRGLAFLRVDCSPHAELAD